MTTDGLTVAVTGPTGEIGRAAIRALERTKGVGAIRGMSRGEVDPAALGWKKTTHVRGDVLDRDAVERLVDGADVVVHLAFVIQAADDDRAVNHDGSANVFRAAVDAGAKRIVYTSS